MTPTLRIGRHEPRLREAEGVHQAHALTTAIYRHTRDLPREEWFGLRAQTRRAAVSVACNIVEGSARETLREHVRFLNIALGSATELRYLVALTAELGLSDLQESHRLREQCGDVVRQLQTLIVRLNALTDPDRTSEDACGLLPEA